MKRILIIKSSKARIHIDNKYLIVKTLYEDKIISYKHIQEAYINKLITISPAQCLKLASYFPLYFINQHGKILGHMELDNEKV